jgi:hypothetical protein
MILADRLMDMPYARQVKQRFENALEEEFTTQDGTILPIRSELTGFTVSLYDHVFTNILIRTLRFPVLRARSLTE